MMHLALSFDHNYLIPFYALVSSVFENNRDQQFTFHCIISGLSDEEKTEIICFVEQNGAKISFYELDWEHLQQFTGTITGTWSIAVYYKMFFPVVVPREVERLLYIDTDTLVVGNLSELYQKNLQGFPLAAVYDNYVKIQAELGIIEEGKYFNSGVMLMDVPLWRAQKISEKAVEFLEKFPEKIKYVDQCALNAVLIDNWLRLEPTYNLIYSYIPQDQGRKALNLLLRQTVIIHFTLQRPWYFLCKNRFRHLYRYYLKKSPKKSEKVILDFEFAKLKDYLRIRLVEFYWDYPLLQKIRRTLKG